MFDLGLVQRNDYYTGVVFSAYIPGEGEAVLSGGRYDSLLDWFGQPMPAVGFALKIDAGSPQPDARTGNRVPGASAIGIRRKRAGKPKRFCICKIGRSRALSVNTPCVKPWSRRKTMR